MARVLVRRERDGIYRRGRRDSRVRSVDASSFVQASQKVPGEMLEAGSHGLSVGTQRLVGNISLSGHILNSHVALGLACWWLSLVWLGAGASGGCAPGAGAFCWLVGLGFLFCGPRPKDRFSSAGIPSMLWDFGSLQQKHRESAGHMVVCVVTDQMVGDRRFPGVTTLWASWSTTSANHPVSVPPTGQELPERSLLFWDFSSLVAAAVFYVFVAAATSASCRGTSQQNIACLMFLQLPTLRRHSLRAVAAATSLSSERRCGVMVVCSRGADDGTVSSEAHFRSPFPRSTRSSWDLKKLPAGQNNFLFELPIRPLQLDVLFQFASRPELIRTGNYFRTICWQTVHPR